MPRHSRSVKDWTPEKSTDTATAPHRYTWNDAPDVDDSLPYRDWVKAQPYQPGDVVWVAYGDGQQRVRIIAVVRERDHYGDYRPAYRVQAETKDGVWSKLWYMVYPGLIQRGYLRAGLAPDLKGKI